jgi:hypothetical protein
MCFPRDSSVSATSGSWLIAVGAHRCPSACNCSPYQAGFGLKHCLQKNASCLHVRFGRTRTAAARWFWLNGSAPLSSDSDLRQIPSRNNDDTIFLIPKLTRIPPPMLYVCLRHLPAS